MIISKTPVRISLFGGGTDYPDYYNRLKGAVLGTTIDKYVYLSINKLSKFFDYKIRVGYSKSELAQEINDIQHPSVRECLKYKNIDTNLDIHIFADLPAKTGLGSSSAFTVGFLNALYALEGRLCTKKQLATEACHVEQLLIGENVGSQDQFHAAYGGFNILEFSKGHVTVRPLLINSQKKALLHQHTLIFYTGISRFATEVLEEQLSKTKAQTNDAHLTDIYESVFAAEDIFLSTDGKDLIQKIGQLLHNAWELKKRLSSKVSNTTIEDLYLKALDAGAYGGKICGAGAGGFLLLIAPLEKHAAIREALSNLLEVSCQFENNGSSIIYYRS